MDRDRNAGRPSREPIMGNPVLTPFDTVQWVPSCPECNEPTYNEPWCPFCGQPFSEEAREMQQGEVE